VIVDFWYPNCACRASSLTCRTSPQYKDKESPCWHQRHGGQETEIQAVIKATTSSLKEREICERCLRSGAIRHVLIGATGHLFIHTPDDAHQRSAELAVEFLLRTAVLKHVRPADCATLKLLVTYQGCHEVDPKRCYSGTQTISI